MKAYCNKCDYEFEYTPKSMKDLDNLMCPKCNEKISHKSKKIKIPTIKEQKIDNALYKIINILRIFYLIVSMIGIVGYFTGIKKVLIICAIVCIVLYTIERIIDINYLWFLFTSIIIAFIICYLKINIIIDSIFLSICIGFAVSTLIREIYFLLLDLIIVVSEKKKKD